jgi:hypothetical protein
MKQGHDKFAGMTLALPPSISRTVLLGGIAPRKR